MPIFGAFFILLMLFNRKTVEENDAEFRSAGNWPQRVTMPDQRLGVIHRNVHRARLIKQENHAATAL